MRNGNYRNISKLASAPVTLWPTIVQFMDMAARGDISNLPKTSVLTWNREQLKTEHGVHSVTRLIRGRNQKWAELKNLMEKIIATGDFNEIGNRILSLSLNTLSATISFR